MSEGEGHAQGGGCFEVVLGFLIMSFVLLFFNWFDARLDRIEKHLGLKDIAPIEAWRMNH